MTGTLVCIFTEIWPMVDDIFVSSLFPCLQSGSNGSTDTLMEARKKVFRVALVSLCQQFDKHIHCYKCSCYPNRKESSWR